MKYILIVIVVLLSRPSTAETITQLEPLSLGAFAVTSNSSVSEISVSLTGRMSSTNKIGRLEPGHPAEYLLSGYSVFTHLYITSIVVSPKTTSPDAPADSAQFDVVNVELPPSVQTDSAGKAAFKLGVTFRTSGNPVEHYYDTEYQGRIRLTINY